MAKPAVGWLKSTKKKDPKPTNRVGHITHTPTRYNLTSHFCPTAALRSSDQINEMRPSVTHINVHVRKRVL